MTSTRSRRGGRTALAVTLAAVLGGTLLGPPAAAEVAVDQGFTEVLDFEEYERTALHGQDGWTASTAARVVADPLNANNQILEMVGGGQKSYRAVPPVAEGDVGTLFFRFMRTGSVDTSFGLTDVDAPSDYVNSRAYVNNQNNDVMLVRDGGGFKPAGVWSRDTWQCVWIVADNATDTVSVYSQGGPYEEITRLPEGTEQQFGFRQGVSGALDRFFWINGSSSAGRLMLDDVAVDASAENLAIATGNPGDCAAGGTTPSEPLLNPLPDPTPSALGIEVEELVQLPESQTTPATSDQRLVRHNRITHLDEVPDGSGRLAVPDMNEILYMVDEETGAHVAYLNVRDRFVDNFHNHAGLGTGFGFVEFHPEFADNGVFYTVHTEAGSALTEDTPDFPAFGGTNYHSVITEWTATDPSAETFAGTSRELMRVPFAGRVHTVQQIAFNPTVEPGDPDHGMLYVLVGDGGNGVGNGNPQDLSTPQGKIFRIDPTGDDSANGQYGIPADNPFVGTPGALGEIYAVGMRDPHRISWDPEGDHAMYLGHIGEWQVESVYEVEAGDNFGWSEREGPFLAENRQIFPLPEDDAENGFTYPVAAYDHNRDPGQTGDAGVALNGGFVYRGDIPELRGRYLFTDLVRGWVLSTQADEMQRNDGDLEDLAEIEHLKVFHDGQETTFQELVGDARVDLRFGADADGELYLVSKADGKVWKVTGARYAGASSPVALPELAPNLVAHYDFDHPVAADATWEADQGWSGTDVRLVNGGTEMRVADRAYPGAGEALQTQQMSPGTSSNDDWKAGVYDAEGVDSLGAFAGTDEISVMGWFKPTGEHPALNSNTANPDDRYNAIGLAGVLSGDSDGHGVRALLEVITVNGELKLVALGRRVDGAGSWTFAADLPWDEILRQGEWVHLAATFDFAGGEMQLFMNGERLEGEYTSSTNPWGSGATSPTDPAGIKIGGSYPQDTREANPFHGRMDDLMFLDTVPTAEQVAAQYALFAAEPGEDPTPPSCAPAGEQVTDVMAAEHWAPRTPSKWQFPGDEVVLAEAGTNPNDGIRRPFEYAVLAEGPELGSFELEAEVRLDAPASVNNRDVIVVFGWQSDTQYYYAHLSQDNTIYAHNGIFKVDGRDRERIDDQWDGSVGAPPAVTDEEWHDVRVVRCADSGDVAVYVDGLDTPLLTANDTTFAEGRVGFGSFDNTGRLRDLTVTAGDVPAEVTVDVTVAPRCLAGKAYLAVRATNTSDVPADVTLTTAYGSRTVAEVAPGAAAYQAFATRSTSLDAGSVTVTASATVDGREVTSTTTADHTGLTCG
ncbi:PQQ-dependent sugar dehydrogenase [Cellulosimicrobium marinum]|uniref:PQQ-dependent sugar dehydrogenase n=1 Tax=Cellulosimicrobium marinum TaxID=1638992 RepID=UPI001E3F1C2E|nr:PQQ-dependent sugar dehydrogenase [Cellulosimicrobium marinum]MCB7137939.1 PQQ-dependent sugar dehydrogenase [Cellulosimicrobium marinum]